MGTDEVKLSPSTEQMEASEEDLRALGFTEYEARAYLVLLQAGPATAYEVSKTTRIHRANAYSVLESLAAKKAVQAISKNPMRYVAVEPERLLTKIARATQDRCNRLSTSLAMLNASKLDLDDHVWTITGDADLTDKINQLIDSARHHVWIKTAESLLWPFETALKKASKRGVQILIILFGENPERFRFGPTVKVYLHEGTGIPVGNANHLMTLTRDFEEAIIGYLRDVPYAAQTRNRPVVLMADTLIRHEIYFAEIFKHFGERIQKKFGPSIINLRRHYLPRDQAKLWDRMVKQKK